MKNPSQIIGNVLDYLSKQREKLIWRAPSYVEQENLEVACQVIHLAWKGDPTPYETAHELICGERLRREAELLAECAKCLPRTPETCAPYDGRRPDHWFRSIAAYLDYRAASLKTEWISKQVVEQDEQLREMKRDLEAVKTARWLVQQQFTNTQIPVRLMTEEESRAHESRRTAARECQAQPCAAGGLERVDEASSGVSEEIAQRTDRTQSGVLPRANQSPAAADRKWHCRHWRTHRRAALRTARGCRSPLPEEGAIVMVETVADDYRALAESKFTMADLQDCFCAKLAAAAKREHGTTLKAAAELGVSYRTLDRWTLHGRLLPIGEDDQCRVNRIALGLMRVHKSAAKMLALFRAGLAVAAVAAAGSQTQAATRLGINRNLVGQLVAKKGLQQ